MMITILLSVLICAPNLVSSESIETAGGRPRIKRGSGRYQYETSQPLLTYTSNGDDPGHSASTSQYYVTYPSDEDNPGANAGQYALPWKNGEIVHRPANTGAIVKRRRGSESTAIVPRKVEPNAMVPYNPARQPQPADNDEPRTHNYQVSGYLKEGGELNSARERVEFLLGDEVLAHMECSHFSFDVTFTSTIKDEDLKLILRIVETGCISHCKGGKRKTWWYPLPLEYLDRGYPLYFQHVDLQGKFLILGTETKVKDGDLILRTGPVDEKGMKKIEKTSWKGLKRQVSKLLLS